MRMVAFAGMAFVLMSGSAVLAQSRPIVIENYATLSPPPGQTYVRFGDQVGTNGEYALVTGARPQQPGATRAQTFDALLYRRINGTWTFQRVLHQDNRSEDDWSYFPVIIGMKGNLASVMLGATPARIFQFNGSDWVQTGTGAGLHEDVSIDGERILYGVGDSWNGRIYERDGSGAWVSQLLQGQIRCCDDEYWGGPVDLHGDRAILATPYTYDLEPQEIPIYARVGLNDWRLATRLQVPQGASGLGSEVALHGDNAFVDARSGPYIWNPSNYWWQPVGRLQTVNSYTRDTGVGKFAKHGNLLLTSAGDADFGRGVINVFRPDANGVYQHIAILKPRGSVSTNGNFEIDGNTVVAATNASPIVFQLPASLQGQVPRYDRFEGGNGGNWTPSAGSQFTVVRPSSVNGVYRQSWTAGQAYSLYNNTEAVNQAIEADIRPTAFDGADRWVGVMTRFADEQNYYYVTLRSSGSVQLKRMRDGAFVTLASAPLTVQTNRTYRVRLESLGTTHRVYVDGALVASVDDTGPQVAGQAGVIMNRAAADIDNVTVSPSRRSTIYVDDFTGPTNWGDWTHNGQGQWGLSSGVYAQNSIAAEARALIGTPQTTDQIASVRIRPTAFGVSNNGQPRWVGVIARYADENNYYYLTLRSDDTLSLRKLVNNAIVVLGTVPLDVNVGAWHSLRLEVMATTLRAYVGDTMVMQVVDTTHARGRAGLMTYKAAAQFGDYAAYQP